MSSYEYNEPTNPVIGFFKKMTPTKLKFTILGVVGTLALLILGPQITQTVEYGKYDVKQAAVTGNISVHNKPGMYTQMFGQVSTYQVSDEYYFSDSKLDGGGSADSESIEAKFNDSSTGKINGMIKYRLSTDIEVQKQLHEDYKSYDNFVNSTLRQHIRDVVRTSATYFSAYNASYTGNRTNLVSLIERQLKEGVYKTEVKVTTKKAADGSTSEVITNVIKKDKDGNPIIALPSPFKRYKIEILQVSISDIIPEQAIIDMLAKKRDAKTKTDVSIEDAKKAQQDTITIKEQGKALIAQEKAKADVDKIKAVVEAQKQREVAEENTKKAAEEAKAVRLKADAEAHANKVKRKAGLSPQEEAEYRIKEMVGVTQAKYGKDGLAGMTLPNTMIIGGTGKGGQSLDPLTAMGLNALDEVQHRMMSRNKASK